MSTEPDDVFYDVSEKTKNDDSNRLKTYRKLYKETVMDDAKYVYPGHQKRYRDFCGSHKLDDAERVVFLTTDFKKIKPITLSCNRILCRVCWRRALYERTKRLETKFNFLSRKFSKKIGIPGHWSFNIIGHKESKSAYRRPENMTEDKFDLPKWRTYMHDLLRKNGFIGYALIFHPYRINKTETGLYWFPHFHVIGFGFCISSDDFFNKYYFTYKFHGRLRTNARLRKVFYYALSHAGAEIGKTYYSYGGILSSQCIKHTTFTEKKELQDDNGNIYYDVTPDAEYTVKKEKTIACKDWKGNPYDKLFVYKIIDYKLSKDYTNDDIAWYKQQDGYICKQTTHFYSIRDIDKCWGYIKKSWDIFNKLKQKQKQKQKLS